MVETLFNTHIWPTLFDMDSDNLNKLFEKFSPFMFANLINHNESYRPLLYSAVNGHATTLVEKLLDIVAKKYKPNRSSDEHSKPVDLKSYFGDESVSEEFLFCAKDGHWEVVQLLVNHLKSTDHLHILVNAKDKEIPLLEAALNAQTDQAAAENIAAHKAFTAHYIYESLSSCCKG